MSYLVLARKWRPQTFGQIIGQPHVTKTLENAIQVRRVAHSYLFTGARGVGKTSVARILAKALNCERGISAHPCNECSNCREITQGNAMDVLEIDGASNRGIDSIRELRETIRYRPAKSPHKIYIVDEVHMLTTEAFNALLKTLEEPPAHVIFIFATTEPHKIPATILSRCQRFDFRRIATSQILAHLQGISREEQLPLSEAVLYSIAREAEGSMRDAQSLLEQILAFSGEGLVDTEILDLLGVIDRQSVQKVAHAIVQADAMSCLAVVADLYQRGIDIKRFCHQLCEYFRNLLFVALGSQAAAAWLDLPAEELQVLQGEVQATSAESLQLYCQMILKGEEDIRRSNLPRITLEMLLLRLTQLPRLESLQTLLGKLDALEKQCAGQHEAFAAALPHSASAVAAPGEVSQPQAVLQGAPQASTAPAAEHPRAQDLVSATAPALALPAGAQPCSAGEAAAQWPAFILWLQDCEPFLGAKLAQSHAAVEASQENLLVVAVAALYADSVKESKAIERLTEAARTFFGQTFRWLIRPQQSSAAASPNPAGNPGSKTSTRFHVMEHPVVQAALEILGGELIDIRRVQSPPAEPPADSLEGVS
jgi:DNA polymerase-3 subunit gamma/tau